MRHVLTLALAAAVAACAAPAAPAGATADAALTADAAGSGADLVSGLDAAPKGDVAAVVPTWSGHIAPLFAQHCSTCHQAGGVGTFRLDDYAAAKPWAKVIKQEVQGRTMPPWGVDNGGSCRTYKDARWLTQAEVDQVAAWVDAGAPEGDKAVPVPKPKQAAALTGEVVQYEMPVDYNPIAKGTPDAPFDDYRCFRIDPKLAKDRFVTGFDVLPGNATVVHHVLVFSVNPLAYPVPAGGKFGTNDAVMQHLDAQKPDRPGWECFGAAGDGVLVGGLPIAWAPGSGATQFPTGTGLKLAQGEELVIQVHYSLATVADPKSILDRTKIKLQLVDQVEREAFMVLHDPFVFSAFTGAPEGLKPGLASTLYKWTAKLPHFDFWVPPAAGKQFDLFGVFPHMHKRGRKMHLTVQHPGKEAECITDVPRWDFDWQQLYLFDQPVPFDDKTILHAVCDYDTSDVQKPVLAGFGTDNEMCMFGLYLAVRK